MERRAGMAGIGAVTVLMALAAVLFLWETVPGGTGADGRKPEEYYQVRARELEETRELLDREGFENSGITVTRVVEEDETRLYTVTVHHGGIDRMDGRERQRLMEELEKISFEAEQCSFVHKFLEDE